MDKIDVDAVRSSLYTAAHNLLLSPFLRDMQKDALTLIDQLTAERDEERECQKLAKQEGISETLQRLDCLTGGDGEYRYLTFGGERHCPDEEAMQASIVARFSALQAKLDAMQAAVVESCHRADSWIHARPSKATTLNDVLEPLREYLPKPEHDPLVEVAQELVVAAAKEMGTEIKGYVVEQEWADKFREGLRQRGYVVMKGEG